MKRARVASLASACLLFAARSLLAQQPSPTPPRLDQDARELQARSNVIQGAGARAYGMGGAFLARPDDATAASWNPAGLSYLRSLEISLVGTHTSHRIVQRDISKLVRREERLSGQAPDFAAATYPLSLGPFSGSVQLGFQRVLSFDGKRSVTLINPSAPADQQTTVRQYDTLGGFDVIALASGLQVSHSLRFGVSYNRWLNGYSYSSDRSGIRPSQQTTNFDFSGWNVNLGGIWSPLEELNLGAVYKTGFTANVDLARSRVDAPAPNFPAATNSDQRSDVSLDFPSAFGFGASWRPRAQLTLSADYTRTNWSDGRIHNYFTLPREGQPAEPEDLFPVLPYPTLNPSRPQADAEQLRAGLEYVLIKGSVKWPLRIGYFSDWQLEKRLDPATQRPDQRPLYHGFTAGTGLIIGRVLVDVAYLLETGRYSDADLESNDPLPRAHSVRSQRVFVSLIYRHKR